ncbi:Retron-type reverse transcriptase [[Clostridium] sordellii]|uniref:reverse transcriptase domain-containing protein n=1 Tax=Paraclostridium sordellii TaxID=1505 RepID=UPI0005EA470F|nr:reverse transcriptase domain-containing protein [Paeniclostridium sordellii]CEN75119.1 Retron-type reverse transcriptase [[Clostridium] sordellii] [Paeniclostridium sordellii]
MFNQIDINTLEFYFKDIKYKAMPGVDRVTAINFENKLTENLDTIIRKINNKTYKFSRLKTITNSKGRTIYIPTIRDRIVIEYLKDRLKYKYKINMANRNSIIENIQNLLGDKLDYFVIRLDIKNFFGSVSNERLLSHLRKKTLLNSNEYYLLHKLLEVSPCGLPEGLSISNYLSEIFLEGFDIKLKDIHKNILFYSRYVDDIIIIIPEKLQDKEIESLKIKVKDIFDHYNLNIDLNNKDKNNFIKFYKNINTDSLNYLGYSFSRTSANKLVTCISENKLNNCFKKIDKIFYSYYYDNKNLLLLYERLHSFCCTNKILKYKLNLRKDLSYYTNKQSIYYGVLNDYKYADVESFSIIDDYIQKKIFHIDPYISDKYLKKKFHLISMCRSKANNSVLIYNKIPLHIIRQKMCQISPLSNYVITFSNRKLLWEYIRLLNNY